jgi:glycosyltransferase EpsD
MRKRILFCATVDYHFQAFHLPYMKWFKDQGWEVHVAANGDMILPFVDKKYNIPISRSPISSSNYLAYKQLKNIIEVNEYRLIHCHTPVGGALARLASRQTRKKGTKVIYTAHGFHFCKGAPKKNWLIYYPVERFLANETDCLITINKEDYKRALQHRFKAGRIEHIHGVGVNTDIFKPIEQDREKLRNKYGYNQTDFLMFYAAEFNKNKNQQLLIEALSLIKNDVPNAKLLLAGEGSLLEECRNYAIKLGLENKVNFLGYRKDIEQLLKIADIGVASSLREGLPVNIMEAMSCGLPIIASNNRGHRELVCNNKTGWIIEGNDAMNFSRKMKLLAQNTEIRLQLGANGRKIIVKKYSTKKILEEQSKLYKSYMGEMEGAKWATP